MEDTPQIYVGTYGKYAIGSIADDDQRTYLMEQYQLRSDELPAW